MPELSQKQFKKIVEKCNKQLKDEKFDPIKKYLNKRKITDDLIDEYELGYGEFYGSRWITIPVTDADDEYTLIKLRRDPFDNWTKNKFMCYPNNSGAAIYGAKNLLYSSVIVVCEGEFDKIILESLGVPAISSTSGAGGFKKEWLFVFQKCEKVYICFDRDDAGFKGAEKLGKMILEEYPYIKVFNCILPEEVGEHGDVSDYVSMQKTEEVNVDNLLYDMSVPIMPEIKEKKENRYRRYNNEEFNNSEITESDIEKASSANCSEFVEIVRDSYNTKWAHCPLPNHPSDNTPSFCCYEGEKGFFCYGCGEGGDAIHLIQKLYGLSFVEAVKFINNS